MVAGPGIEPGTRAYETRVLPLHYPAIEVVVIPPNVRSTWRPKCSLVNPSYAFCTLAECAGLQVYLTTRP